MSEEKSNKEDLNNSEQVEPKILYGTNNKICFACGQKLEKDSDVCPYCKTPIK